MIDTTVLEAHYGSVFEANKHILDMSAFEMISYLQQQFNHVEDGTPFSDKEQLEREFRLLISESNETRNHGLTPKNLTEIRDGIADQLTIAYFLAFKVQGFNHITFTDLNLPTPKSYTEYLEGTEATIKKLQNAIFKTDSMIESNYLLNYLIAQLYVVPEFSNFDIDYDLIDATFSSLSKICTATDDMTALELAELTCAKYSERGYKAEIKQTAAGYGIFVNEECVVKGENIPAGRFLKSLEMIPNILANIHEESVW